MCILAWCANNSTVGISRWCDAVSLVAEHKSNMLMLTVLLHRDIKSHILVTYFPSALFVSVSWGSFLVSPEVVPGRMVLLVTTLLTLVTMLNTVR